MVIYALPMWDGITPVLAGYDPIIGESEDPFAAIVLNTGPDPVRLRAWDQAQPDQGQRPREMELRAGATRAVVARLLRVQIVDGDAPHGGAPRGQAKFAAVGWRLAAIHWGAGS
jgi:hypothetical protein